MMAQTAWPVLHGKRLREDEYADISSGGILGFTEHRSKRQQSQAIPFRSSTYSGEQWPTLPSFHPACRSSSISGLSHTMMPSNSDSEEQAILQPQNYYEESQVWNNTPNIMTQRPSPEPMVSEPFDYDKDMMDTFEPLCSADSLCDGQVDPRSLQPDSIRASIAGCMPTPIQCSFAVRVRGNNWGGAVSNTNHSDTLFKTTMENVTMGATSIADVMIQSMAQAQNRLLPSPINEQCGENEVALIDQCDVYDDTQVNCHGHHHPLLAGMPPRANSAVKLGQMSDSLAHHQRADMPAVGDGHGHAMDFESHTSPSPKKGHTRSRHTLSSWTSLQPGMKKSFSIGYRADCEKCRTKVPGHFNHIIVS